MPKIPLASMLIGEAPCLAAQKLQQRFSTLICGVLSAPNFPCQKLQDEKAPSLLTGGQHAAADHKRDTATRREGGYSAPSTKETGSPCKHSGSQCHTARA